MIKTRTRKQAIEKIKKDIFSWFIIFYFGTLSLILTLFLSFKYPNSSNLKNVFLLIFMISYYILFLFFTIYCLLKLTENFKKYLWTYMILLSMAFIIAIFFGVYHFYGMKGLVSSISALIIAIIAIPIGTWIYHKIEKKFSETSKKELNRTKK